MLTAWFAGGRTPGKLRVSVEMERVCPLHTGDTPVAPAPMAPGAPADRGGSRTRAYRYWSSTAPSLTALRRVAFLTWTGNGIDGARFDIAVLDTEDFSVVADYKLFDSPWEAAFSPDGALLYVVRSVSQIDSLIVDEEQLAAAPAGERQFGTPRSWTGPSRLGTQELYVDPTGQYLFASIEGQVRDFDTGRRVVPESASWTLHAAGLFVAGSRVLRRSQPVG